MGGNDHGDPLFAVVQVSEAVADLSRSVKSLSKREVKKEELTHSLVVECAKRTAFDFILLPACKMLLDGEPEGESVPHDVQVHDEASRRGDIIDISIISISLAILLYYRMI
jgi:hypothetical protein